MQIDHKIKLKLDTKPCAYEVSVGLDLLGNTGLWANQCLDTKAGKVAIVSNEKVFRFYGNAVEESLASEGYHVTRWLMPDGEEHKNYESLQELLIFLSSKGFTRSDAIVALGGGVVGDLAGFASAVYMRGIKFLQIPTTFLAMIDASVGGKTAINFASGKNLVGAFHHPHGVLVDVTTLATLDRRELAAGFYEAIKHGAVGGENLLREIVEFLHVSPIETSSEWFHEEESRNKLTKLIAGHIDFKAHVVMEDEIEATNRRDSRSRKILNFGHTVGHALEKVTDYSYFKHGEAVGYGIRAAADLSKRLELLDGVSLELLNDVVASVGVLPDSTGIDQQQVIDSFRLDKKMDGESLDWVLLKGIGMPIVVRDKEVPTEAVAESLRTILS